MSPLIPMIFVLMSLLIIGSPVIFAIASAALTYFLIAPGMMGRFYMYVHTFFTGMDSFVLLCIPLFILAGEIMKRSGMLSDLVNFTQIVVGRFKGGLAYVNVLASMLFGGISGSGLADVSSLGPIEIAMMKEAGYSGAFSAALTATSAIQGPIIPPSIPIVIFASVTGVSVGALFLAGAIPGILIGIGQMVMIFIICKRRNFPKSDVCYGFKKVVRVIASSFFALLMPIIIVGGIIGGIFTPTEAAAVAVFYSLVISLTVYRKIKLKDIKEILYNSIKVTSSVYLIIGFTGIISWIFAIEKVPSMITTFVTASALSPYTLLFLVNLFLLFNGMWISDTAQLILFAPLFTRIFTSMGINPVHFGIVFVVNVMIGMITPPYGMALYLAAAIGKVELRKVVIETIPFTIVSILVLFLITYIPLIVLFLPKLFNLV